MPAFARSDNGFILHFHALIRFTSRMLIPWERVDVRVNGTGRVRTDRRWRLERNWSEGLRDYDLWFVWAGLGRMRTRQQDLVLRPGVCLWMRPGGMYLAEQNEEQRLGVSYLHFDLLDGRGRPFLPRRMPAEVHELLDVNFADAIAQRIVELMGAGWEGVAVAAGLLKALLMNLDYDSGRPQNPVSGAYGVGGHHYRRVMPVASQILQEPGRVAPVSELARRAGYSPDHFARVFRAVTGRHPQDFIIQARVDHARQLLVESSMSVKEVAHALGYRDEFYFCRQFKQRVGAPPTVYRREHHGGQLD
ncbi:MAG: helix-turn-helix transcriptional regulator [Terrimicrobiaceae bacterium]